MPTVDPQKKPAQVEDWHPSEVKGALNKAGWSLRQLGFANGYTGDSSLSEVFRRPWPKVEAIIAKAVGVKPQAIWPSRYTQAGKPNRPRGRAPMRPSHINMPKANTGAGRGNPQTAARA